MAWWIEGRPETEVCGRYGLAAIADWVPWIEMPSDTLELAAELGLIVVDFTSGTAAK